MTASAVDLSPTGNAAVDGLLSGVRWTTGALTFAFPATGAAYGGDYAWSTSPEPQDGFVAFTTAQQAYVRGVLADYADFANLTFTEISGSADLRFGRSAAVDRDGSAFAWAYYPDIGAGGDVWFRSDWSAVPTVGSFDHLAVMHEIGHALGLKHPFEASGAFPALPAALDGNDFTVMSYDAYPGAGYNVVLAGSHPHTPMQYDIAALQALYGANFRTHAENTIYRWNGTTGEAFVNGVGQGVTEGNKIYETVWDGGGRDTYDFSSFGRALHVDLTPGGWVAAADPVGGPQAYFGGGRYAPGMVANAFRFGSDPRSLIENAVGGSGSDVMTGNETANRLEGRAGADTLAGGAGADTLAGGAGPDRAEGGAGNDLVDYAAAPGAVVVDLANGKGAGGQATGDSYAGIESVLGSAFNDRLVGNAYANTLNGGAGADRLEGGGGNDVLSGGAGNDVLVGGAGSDLFLFAPGCGVDRILDFTAGTTVDALKISAALYASASAALAGARQVGADVHLDLGTGGVDLVGVKLGDLTTADFFIA